MRLLEETLLGKNSETKNQPKDRSFRPDVPADIRPKTSVRPSKSWKNKHFGTGMPRGGPRKNFGLKNFGLIFRSLKIKAGSFYKQFGVFAYSWSVLLTVNWLGLLVLLLTLQNQFVFFTFRSPPCPKIGFGLFCLRIPHQK